MLSNQAAPWYSGRGTFTVAVTYSAGEHAGHSYLWTFNRGDVADMLGSVICSSLNRSHPLDVDGARALIAMGFEMLKAEDDDDE